MNAKQIMSGAAKNIASRFYTEESEIVKRRRDICGTCKENGVVHIPILNAVRNGCTICNCPFPEKWKIPSEKCPINKW